MIRYDNFEFDGYTVTADIPCLDGGCISFQTDSSGRIDWLLVNGEQEFTSFENWLAQNTGVRFFDKKQNKIVWLSITDIATQIEQDMPREIAEDIREGREYVRSHITHGRNV